MNKMTSDFPPDLQEWIAARVAERHYQDAGDYLRDLVERDRDGLVAEPEEESPEDIAWVREQVAIGLASGICEQDAFEFLRELREGRHDRQS